MADRIRGVAAVGQDVVEGFEAGDGLILAEGAISRSENSCLGISNCADGFGERNEDGMPRSAVVTGVEFALPLVEQCERSGGVADFVAEIVGDAAVGVDVEEMLAQAARKKPAGDGEIFVVGAGEAGAVFASFGERGRGCAGWRSRRAGGDQPRAASGTSDCSGELLQSRVGVTAVNRSIVRMSFDCLIVALRTQRRSGGR